MLHSKTLKRFALVIVIVMASSLFLLARTNEAVSYPTGYLKWTHLKQATQPAESSPNNKPRIYHIYGNDSALAGLRNNKQFADGSSFVVDFFETKDANGKLSEAARAQVAVMVKDGKRYAKTGGWGFEQFKGDSQIESMLNADGAAKCYACHGQKETSGVFTTYNK